LGRRISDVLKRTGGAASARRAADRSYRTESLRGEPGGAEFRAVAAAHFPIIDLAAARRRLPALREACAEE
jgi:hypothetical protein